MIEVELPSVDSLLSKIYDINTIKSVVTMQKTHKDNVLNIYCIVFNDNKVSFVLLKDDLLFIIDNMPLRHYPSLHNDVFFDSINRYFKIDNNNLIEMVGAKIREDYYVSKFHIQSLNITNDIYNIISKYINSDK